MREIKFIKYIFIFLGILLFGVFFMILRVPKTEKIENSIIPEDKNPIIIKDINNNQQSLGELIFSKFGQKVPKEWGEKVSGVKTKLDTNEKVLALTFDACGGPDGSNYDAELIDYLRANRIPATLFLSGTWIDKNLLVFKDLAKDSLFLIANHGTEHKPCSVNGKSAFNIKGANNIGEVIEEIEGNALGIKLLTGEKPKYYRSGTGYTDEICVGIANELGYEVVGFDIEGDKGATFSKNQIKNALLGVKPGSIISLHMNHPEGNTLKGLKEAIPILKNQGYNFVKLSDFKLK